MTQRCGQLAAIIGVLAAVVIAMVVAALLSRSYVRQDLVHADQCTCPPTFCHGRILIRITVSPNQTIVDADVHRILCRLQPMQNLTQWCFAIQVLESSMSIQAPACSADVTDCNKNCSDKKFCSPATVELLYSQTNSARQLPDRLSETVLGTLNSQTSGLSYQLFQATPQNGAHVQDDNRCQNKTPQDHVLSTSQQETMSMAKQRQAANMGVESNGYDNAEN